MFSGGIANISNLEETKSGLKWINRVETSFATSSEQNIIQFDPLINKTSIQTNINNRLKPPVFN